MNEHLVNQKSVEEWSAPLVLIGDGAEFDCELDKGPRLALGLLGVEVRDLWGCADCSAIGCLVYVERYDEHTHGSTSALCEACVARRLAR
jgi:hypothetical protein